MDFKQLYDKSTGITKYKLAKELNVSWQTIQNWYLGKNEPHVREQKKIIEILKKYS
jgi:DNA-binding transcriptional regulator YiaG